jgi:glutamate formiminotransferase/glutamate formiminotransferase/formiminotetrahydrofolate cyclodeaminase
MAVPNVSEGRDHAVIDRIAAAFSERSARVRLLDVHSDADHDRSVFTLAGEQQALADALLAGAHAAVTDVDVVSRDAALRGQHPHVGALDVVPIVYLSEADEGAACAAALVVGDRLAHELALPVLLYGELADGRTRAVLRRGGLAGLAKRLAAGEVRPDFGPPTLHPTAGATLLAARPPLVAFNIQLAPPATLAEARAIATRIREGGQEGIQGLRAIGIELKGSVAQVSTNVERPFELPLAEVVEAVRKHAPIATAELIGLAPAAALEGFPDDVPMPGFDPRRHIIENALRC